MMRLLQTAKWMTAVVLVSLSVQSPVRAQESVPAGVLFEKNIEYSNPDDQHLQLNMARPKEGTGPFPAVICIHGVEKASMDSVCNWQKKDTWR